MVAKVGPDIDLTPTYINIEHVGDTSFHTSFSQKIDNTLEKIFLPYEDPILPYEGIFSAFEEAFYKYTAQDSSSFISQIEALGKEAKVVSDADFLSLSFEELMKVPVHDNGTDVTQVDTVGQLSAVTSGGDAVFVSGVGDKAYIDSLERVGSVSRILGAPSNADFENYRRIFGIGLYHDGKPSAPDNYIRNVDAQDLNFAATISFLGNVFTPSTNNNFFAATYGPDDRLTSYANFNIYERPGSTVTTPMLGVYVLTTPEGNTLTYYDTDIAGHTAGDYVYTLQFPHLIATTPAEDIYYVGAQRYFIDRFTYSLVDYDGDIATGTFYVYIQDAHPVATDISNPTSINESDIITSGSNLLGVANVLGGSIITSPTDPFPNFIGINGGIVSDVTIAGGATVHGVSTITVTDGIGNVFVVDINTGAYTFTLNNPYTNIANAPTVLIFHYTFLDNNLNSASADLTITVNDDSPIAVAETGLILEANIPGSGSAGAVNPDTIDGELVPSATSLTVSRYGADGADAAGGVTNVTLAGAATTFGTIDGVMVANSNGGFTAANLGHAAIIVTDLLGNTLVVDRLTSQYVYTLNSPLSHTGGAPNFLAFDYTITDADGSQATSTLTIEVRDDTPIAIVQTNTVDETALFVNGTETATGNILTGTTYGGDGPGGITSVFGVTDASDGLVDNIINASTTYGSIAVYLTANGPFAAGDYVYTLDSAKTQPVSDGLGSVVDNIAYVLTDSDGSTASSTLDITVDLNQTPTPQADTATVGEDSTLSSAAPGVLANDTDPDPADTLLVVSSVAGLAANVGALTVLPSGATILLSSDGQYSYDTNGAFNYLAQGESTTDTITYGVKDAEGLEGYTTLTVTITGANDAPVAVDDTGGCNEDTTLIVSAGMGLLSNDTDPDTSDTLSIGTVEGLAGNVGVQITLASGALLTVNADGSYTYDPNGQFNYLGVGATTTDSFNYEAKDNNGALSGVAIATITITGSVPPIILDLNDDNHTDLISLANSNVQFDVNGDGTQEHIAWVGPEDGLLVYDYQGDGKVTDINEFSFAHYVDGAKTDLEGLKAFDTNLDGKLDFGDLEFDKFNVWQDKNSNGVVDDGEMMSLIQRGIVSLSLGSDNQSTVLEGNLITGFTSYETTDGQTHLAADAKLQVGPTVETIDQGAILQNEDEIDFSSLTSTESTTESTTTSSSDSLVVTAASTETTSAGTETTSTESMTGTMSAADFDSINQQLQATAEPQ